MNSFARWILLLGGLSLSVAGSFACRQQTVRPDEMSAARHREEAQRMEQAAKQHERSYDRSASEPRRPPPPSPHGGEVDYDFMDPIYNSTEWHLDEAERLREHAAQHRRAARFLERFEEGECRHFPPATRAACPLLGPVAAIVDIPAGVRVTLSPGTRPEVVLAHMRCHYAYAQAQGFTDAATCALYVKGIEIRASADKVGVEIVSKDPAVSKTIRERSRDEAVFLHGRRP